MKRDQTHAGAYGFRNSLLDELIAGVFDIRALEVLRQPMEDKQVTISRAAGTLTFPANFMLVAPMNPCPCGWHGASVKPCTCTSALTSRYQHKISGPLLDRIDIHLDVAGAEYGAMWTARSYRTSAPVW